MKTLITLMVVLTIGLSTSLSAKKAPPAAAKLPADFKQEIANHIDYPDHAKHNMIEGVVTMQVTLDNNSKVKIVDLSSTNPELGDYVRNELSTLTIENTSFKPGSVYYMKVRFDIVSGF